MTRRLVVIGADAAGMSAAAQARRGPEPPEVIAFERGSFTSYAACGLPYLIAGLVKGAESLVARTPDQHRASGVDVRLRHEVTAIRPDRREIDVHSLDDDRFFTQDYDELLIATGASPVRPPIPGLDASGVFGIHTIPDAMAIDRHIVERDVRNAVVVGGGYIGLEMAEALLLRGLSVTLVERLSQPMATLDPEMGARVAEGMRGQGIDLRLDTSVLGIEAGPDDHVRAVTTDAGTIGADLVILGLGVRPSVALAETGGVPLGPSGAIVTDERMATPLAGVWAAGDCVESRHRVSGRPVNIALGTHANKQGRVAGLNLSGGEARFPGVIGTAITKVGTLEIARTGLSSREAEEAGFDPIAATIEGESRAHYYPGGMPMAIRVIADGASGRMLGAQIVGGEEAAKRIDALAVGIWNEMTTDDFAQLDLAYAPPFSPVWDPILIAARQTRRRRP